MAEMDSNISVIILKVNRLNNTSKRQRLSGWIKKKTIIQKYTAYIRHTSGSKTQIYIESKTWKKPNRENSQSIRKIQQL